MFKDRDINLSSIFFNFYASIKIASVTVVILTTTYDDIIRTVRAAGIMPLTNYIIGVNWHPRTLDTLVLGYYRSGYRHCATLRVNESKWFAQKKRTSQYEIEKRPDVLGCSSLGSGKFRLLRVMVVDNNESEK